MARRTPSAHIQVIAILTAHSAAVVCLVAATVQDSLAPSIIARLILTSAIAAVIGVVLTAKFYRGTAMVREDPENQEDLLHLDESGALSVSKHASGQASLQREELALAQERLDKAILHEQSSKRLCETAARRFEELFMGIPIACFTTDSTGTVYEWNRSAEELWGVPSYAALHRPFFSSVGGVGQFELFREILLRVFEGESIESIEIGTSNTDGEQIWAVVSAFPVRAADGIITGAVWSFVDITERKKQADLVRESEYRIRTTIEWMQSGVILMDANGAVTMCNHRSAEILGWDVETLMSEGFSCASLNPIPQANVAPKDFVCPVSASLATGELFRDTIVGLTRADGNIVWVSLNVAPINGTDPSSGIVISFEDITLDLANEAMIREHLEVISAYSLELEASKASLEEANEKLRAIATTDGLTGLKNHRSFQEFLDIQFDQASRYNHGLSLILLDVDHFKLFNDSFGHQAGDDVLREVGSLLLKSARKSDFVARYGGEEFIVVLPSTREKGMIRVAERIRATIESAPWEHRSITVSLGCSTLNAKVENKEALIRLADEALYEAKRAGRNRFVLSSTCQQAA